MTFKFCRTIIVVCLFVLMGPARVAFADDHPITSLSPDPSFEFNDKGNTAVTAAGTWIGHPEPLNIVRLTADRGRMVITTYASVIAVELMPKQPLFSVEQEEIQIETWTADAITSKRVRCGTSERFVQIIIDRKAKTVTQQFTGKYPASQELGDGTQQFEAYFHGTYKPQ